MPNYIITINGYESGLTANAVKIIVRNSFPEAENIEVSEQ